MVEQIKPPVKPPIEPPVKFTKMRNTSNKILQLSCGAVAPGKEVAFNVAEFSTLHMLLEGVE